MKKILLILLLLISACSTINQDFIEPEVAVVNVNVSDVSLFRTKLKVAVEIDNENDFPLNIDNSIHKLYINGEYIGKGISGKNIKIEPYSKETQEINFSVQNLSIFKNIQNLAESSNLNYKIESNITAGSGWGRRKFSVEKSGVVLDMNS